MTSVPFSQLMQDSTKVGDPVPAGKYPALVESCTFATAKNGRDPQWKIRWKIQGGPHNGRVVIDNQTLPLGGAPGDDMDKIRLRRGFFFRDMATLGFDVNYFNQNPDPNLIAQQMAGRPAMLSITVNGRYNNVDGYEQLTGQQAMPQAAQPQQQGGFQPAPAAAFPQQAQQNGGFVPQQPAAAQPQPQPMQQGGFAPQPQPAQQGFQPQPQSVGPQPGMQQDYGQAQGQQPQPQPQPQPAQPMQAPAPQPAQQAPAQQYDPNTGQPLTPAPQAPF